MLIGYLNMLKFNEFTFLTESIDKTIAKEIANKFSEFKSKPIFSRDNKTIHFDNLNIMDKDSILYGLKDYFKKYTRLKNDFGNLVDYRINDTFVSIKYPKKTGNKYQITLKFI